MKNKHLFAFIYAAMVGCMAAAPQENLGNLPLIVKGLDGKKHVITLAFTDNIGKVKDVVYDLTGVAQEQQRISFRNKTLPPKSALNSLFLQPYDEVSLAVTLLGGDLPSFDFTDFSTKDTSSLKQFSTTAPDWRVIYPGFNIEGICKNADCEAVKARGGERAWVWTEFKNSVTGKVIDRFQGTITEGEFMNYFDMWDMRENCICQSCKQPIEPENVKKCGFYGCKYDIKGLKQGEKKHSEVRNKKVDYGSGFMYFDKKCVPWNYIRIVVQKLNGQSNIPMTSRLVIKNQLIHGIPPDIIAETFELGKEQILAIAREEKLEGY